MKSRELTKVNYVWSASFLQYFFSILGKVYPNSALWMVTILPIYYRHRTNYAAVKLPTWVLEIVKTKMSYTNISNGPVWLKNIRLGTQAIIGCDLDCCHLPINNSSDNFKLTLTFTFKIWAANISKKDFAEKNSLCGKVLISQTMWY